MSQAGNTLPDETRSHRGSEHVEDCRVNSDGTAENEKRPMGWIFIAAASAVLFVEISWTNTFGVFLDHYQR